MYSYASGHAMLFLQAVPDGRGLNDYELDEADAHLFRAHVRKTNAPGLPITGTKDDN